MCVCVCVCVGVGVGVGVSVWVWVCGRVTTYVYMFTVQWNLLSEYLGELVHVPG